MIERRMAVAVGVGLSSTARYDDRRGLELRRAVVHIGPAESIDYRAVETTTFLHIVLTGPDILEQPGIVEQLAEFGEFGEGES